MFASLAAREEVGGSDDDGGLARLTEFLSWASPSVSGSASHSAH